MNNENYHPHLEVPPLAHALHRWNPETRILSYEYNGIDLITLHIPGSHEPGFRHGSDGSLQNIPCMQQLYFMQDEVQTVRLSFRLSHEACCMRPHRAGKNQAIVGQMGLPLMYGVNGLYDIAQDLLIDWHGAPWNWNSSYLEPDSEGALLCSLDVELGPRPFFMNLRMHYYRQHLGYSYHEPWKFRPQQKSVVGWCSWEAYRRDVNQGDIDRVSQFFGEKLRPWGFEYLQVDDGYQPMPLPYKAELTVADGWLATNQQFPGGHLNICTSIHQAGLVPGIWTNANVTNKDFAKNNQSSLICGADGQPLLGEWIDYLLDCSPQTLEAHVHPYYQGLKEKGYQYFKTDAIRHLLFDGLHEGVRQGILSNEEAEIKFRAFMESARDGIGADSYFLASWGVMAEVVGLVDACRIAMDANPTWAGIRMQLVETARWFATQRILFLNDPDHICARAELSWVRTVVSLLSLSGSLYMLSDPLETYDEDRLALIRKTIPTLKTMAGETGPLDLDYAAFTWTKLHGFAVPRENPVQAEGVRVEDAINMAGSSRFMDDDHPFGALWSFHLRHLDRSWSVLGRFATVPLRASRIELENLALDPTLHYHCFDFWKQSYRGMVKDVLLAPALDLGECQVMALLPASNEPDLLATSRHVSMGAIELSSRTWNPAAQTLAVNLEGVIGTQERFWFTIPKDLQVVSVSSQQGPLVIHPEKEEGAFQVTVDFTETSRGLTIQYR